MKIFLRWIELLALGVGVPVIFFIGVTHTIMIFTLWIAALVSLFYLQRQSGFAWKRLWHGVWVEEGKVPQRLWPFRSLRFIVACAACIALLISLEPDRLFWLPQTRPGWWAVIMILYPLLSVIPQEIVFRALFFERYRPLFQNKCVMIIASAAFFGLSHIQFHNWVAPPLAFIGGLIFAASYARDKSLKWAVVEHALYGCMVFTVGLGMYFYGGLR